jgi:ABC-type branched-subunit amino acid transport system ATPase component
MNGDRTTGALEEELLRVEGVSVDFGGVHAVSGATFAVHPGGVVGLIGPNGAGKSTLVGVLAGAVRPTSGLVTFRGTDVTGWAPHKLARLGLIRTFQLAGEFASMSVLENVMLGARDGHDSLWRALAGRRAWRGIERKRADEARHLLESLGLGGRENEIARKLSGGQRRLMEVARALMSRPVLLLMDEPFAGVTPALVERIAGALSDLREQGVTVLIVEHDLKTLWQLCDSVVVMARGAVVAEGPASELQSDPQVLDAYIA